MNDEKKQGDDVDNNKRLLSVIYAWWSESERSGEVAKKFKEVTSRKLILSGIASVLAVIGALAGGYFGLVHPVTKEVSGTAAVLERVENAEKENRTKLEKQEKELARLQRELEDEKDKNKTANQLIEKRYELHSRLQLSVGRANEMIEDYGRAFKSVISIHFATELVIASIAAAIDVDAYTAAKDEPDRMAQFNQIINKGTSAQKKMRDINHQIQQTVLVLLDHEHIGPATWDNLFKRVDAAFGAFAGV